MTRTATVRRPEEIAVQYLKGVGPARAKLLERLGIRTVEDLLYHLPAHHHDLRHATPLNALTVGTTAVVSGKVIRTVSRRAYRGGTRTIQTVDITDGRGFLTCVFFNRPYVTDLLSAGTRVVMSGKVGEYRGRNLQVKECVVLSEEEGGDDWRGRLIIPIYGTTEGLRSGILHRLIRTAMDLYLDGMAEPIDEQILRRRRIPNLVDALRRIHLPENMEEATLARRRFVYQELFVMQTVLALRRARARSEKAEVRLRLSSGLDFRIRLRFPFTLTQAQERVIAEIRKDLSSERPMNRLLQGDVGSGKTVVAGYALLTAIGNRAQGAIMAPTEILAEQHHRTFQRMLAGSKVRIRLLVSGLTKGERAEILREIREGEADLIIGTHALIEEAVEFQRLAVAVIDEQHRFGVAQRALLRRKGGAPHVLVMTATPIPRTLALTLFGDLDVSVIDELPPGRKKIRTMFRPASRLPESFPFLRRKLGEGRQIYFVYPLIDESDKLSLKSAKRMARTLSAHFSDWRIGLLHGAMTGKEKERVMEEFRSGALHILVSTVVIEVGIDIPNATVMVVEHAERYGLAQLHQLRGRIGRGEEESYFLLFGDAETEEARRRLEAVTSTSDGFKIAEEDLRIRGPGELLGARQSGLPPMKAAELPRDLPVLLEAREDVRAVLARDPDLRSGANAVLKRRVTPYLRLASQWMTTG